MDRSAVRNGFISLLSVAAGLSASEASHGAVVFSDGFNRPNSSAISNGWTEVNAAGSQGTTDGDASILDGALLLTNDSTTATNFRGRTYVLQDSSTFGGGYQPVLGASTGLVSWSFNTKLIYSVNASSVENDLTGFNYIGGGNYGIAFVLGAASKSSGGISTVLTNGTSDNTGDGFGYAIVIGANTTGVDDAVRLVRFSDGLRGTALTNASITEIIKDTIDHNTDYLSLRVTFDPSTGAWSLFENSNTSGFIDPSTVVDQVGTSVIDTTYTSTALPYTGPVWNYANGSNATQGGSRVIFDNISVSVAANSVPEPGIAITAFSGLAVLSGRRRRHTNP